MECARGIGRVGAVAVALGIGVAVGGQGGMAWAQPGDSPAAGADGTVTAVKSPAGRSAATRAAASVSGASTGESVTRRTLVGSRPVMPPVAVAHSGSAVGGPVASPVAALLRPSGGLTPAAVQSGLDPAVSVGRAAVAPAVAVLPPAARSVGGVLSVPRAAAAASSAAATAQGIGAAADPTVVTGSGGAPTQASLMWTVAAWTRRGSWRSSPGGVSTPAAATPTTSPAQNQSPNLLDNGGAELGDPSLSGYSAVSIPGWSVTGTPTVIKYGTPRVFPAAWSSTSGVALPGFLAFPGTGAAPAGAGAQFFGGGPVGTSTLTQTVDLGAAAAQIATGTLTYNLSGDLGGFTIDPSRASVTVTFLGAQGQKLGSGKIAPVTALQRGLKTGLQYRQSVGTIPVGTVSAQVVVTLADHNPVLGNYNNAYADNLSFTVGDAGIPAPPPPAPPASTVGKLDHVYVIYLENYGYSNIVGNRNAPYINSLIKTYDSASNYYALTHPSNPNYFPVLGGSDYGINYNCANACTTASNLADELDTAGKTWAGYSQDGSGYSIHDHGLMPFFAFADIFNNPARVDSHIVNISQLAGDLSTSVTAPNFAWISPDEATNMEGPFFDGTIMDKIKASLSHILPRWLGGQQYNIPAGDKWTQSTLSTIMDSASWQDPSQTSAVFITWDEDYNNGSIGVGNQGNHVPMIVVPSPGAVAAGMQTGGFVATDHYNHYSLMATIEDALGLAPLTNNDKYAQPMNQLWT